MFVGRSSSRPPTENTLTVNITHEILEDIQEVFGDTVAVSPTREEENEYGYDVSVDWDWMKIFALQFKTFREKNPIRLNGSNTSKKYYKYPLKQKQHEQLRDHFSLPGMAFYVLPVFPTRDELSPPILKPELLFTRTSDNSFQGQKYSRVFFIDIHDVPVGATKISISTDVNTVEKVACYCKDREHHAIESENVSTWQDLWNGLLSCNKGLKTRHNGSETGLLHDLIGSWDQPMENKSTGNDIQKTIRITIGADDLPKEASNWRH